MAGSRPSTQEPRRQPATDAERGAEEEADDRGDADQADRPRQAVDDHLATRRREERERQAQVAVEELRPSSRGTAPTALWSLSSPNSTCSDWIASALIRPWLRRDQRLTGSPGISRGMKKLRVIAAQAVNR